MIGACVHPEDWPVTGPWRALTLTDSRGGGNRKTVKDNGYTIP